MLIFELILVGKLKNNILYVFYEIVLFLSVNFYQSVLFFFIFFFDKGIVVVGPMIPFGLMSLPKKVPLFSSHFFSFKKAY